MQSHENSSRQIQLFDKWFNFSCIRIPEYMSIVLHYSSLQKCLDVQRFILAPYSVLKFRLWILTCSHTRTVHDKFNYLSNDLIFPALESQNIYSLALFILPEMFKCVEIHIGTLLCTQVYTLTIDMQSHENSSRQI
jgi:hypothetical protein